MEATELMIGDWVICGNITQEQVQVVDICATRDIVFLKFFSEPRLEKISNIKPIPLTPEILEKNGFEKQGFPGWQIYTKEYLILWRNDYPNVLHIDSFSSDYGSFDRFNVDYVHQLQHALKLCGITKEIVL